MQHSRDVSALPGRKAGVCMHLTSLPGDHGIGEIGESALRFVDLLASMNMSVWQFLPTGPTGYADSPYQEFSTYAGNELLIDCNDLIGRGFLSPDAVTPLKRLPLRSVAFGKLTPIKHAFLRRATAAFETRADAVSKAEFDEFVEENDETWLHHYALFRTLKDRHDGKPWPEWQQDFVRRRRAAISRLENSARSEIRYWKICQFFFARQWKTLRRHASDNRVRLFGDMPMYIALDSADAWTNPEILCIDRAGKARYVAGVPPDYFSRSGQLWGNPVYDWSRQAEDGFAWWIARLRHAVSRFDIVRIDHFRGFDSYWAVPARSRSAKRGRWRTGPRHAVLDAFYDAMPGAPIVAEDLGMVTPQVEALRKHYGIPGMKVLQFEVTEKDFDIGDIPEHCVCYTGTHDNDTTRGWFDAGCGARDRKQEIRNAKKRVLAATGGTARTIAIDLVRLAFQSKARLAVVPMQDLLGLGTWARLNTPGRRDNNWRWRVSAKQLTTKLRDIVSKLAETTERGRDA
ncbi:MAG: 4-alpha-glucanotransferase [Woeseiaceae bacterium]|nr:4-alpha-glucanotransferase [Woeseiaceae bacterium]